MKKRKIWDAAVMVFGIAAMLAVFGLMFSLFIVMARDAGEKERREIVISTSDRAPVAPSATVAEEEAEDVIGRFEIYREGEGPAPAWYDPDGPMSVEWFASCKQVEKSNKEAGFGDYFETELADQQVKFALDMPVNGDGNSSEAGSALDTDDYLLDVPLSEDFQRYLHGLCEEAEIPFVLAVAVIEAESTYQPDVISATGDWGIMQINEICHAWLSELLGITDYLDPYQNARAGVWLLGWHYARFGYESGTLIAYNQGQAAAEELFGRGIYATAYSERVIGIRYRLETEGK